MFRKGTAAIIINNNKEFLLVNLEAFEEKNFAIPGGGQDLNESLLECAYREIKEELNIDKTDLEYVNKSPNTLKFYFRSPQVRDGVEYIGSERHYFGFKFTGQNPNVIPMPGEVRSYKWVKYEDLKNYLLFEQQLEDTQIRITEIFGKV